MHCGKCGKALNSSSEFCGKCGTVASKKEVHCNRCSTAIANDGLFCAQCGMATKNKATPKTWKTKAGRYFVNGVDVTSEDSYWRNEFRKICESDGSYTGKFNWAAFLFGAFWFFAKGLPVTGLIWFAVALAGGVLTFGLFSTFVWIAAGFRANYIRYMKIIEKKDVYF